MRSSRRRLGVATAALGPALACAACREALTVPPQPTMGTSRQERHSVGIISRFLRPSAARARASANRPESPLAAPPAPPEPVIATLPVSAKITPATATRPAPVAPTRQTHATASIPDETVTRLIYDLVRERLLNSVGPTGSFAVTVRSGTTDDSLFTQAFAESLARDITATLQHPAAPAHPHPVPPQPVHPERLSA